jgi:hypothetical protein
MEHVDYGLSVFERSALEAGGSQALDLTGVFQELIAGQRLAGFEVAERFYEVGSWNGIQALRAYLAPTAPAPACI